MSQTENNSKKSVAILSVLLAITAVLAIALFVMKQNTEAALTQEKELVIQDLTQLQAEYDGVVTQNEEVNQALTAAKAEVAQFLDSISGLNADIATLSKFRARFYSLQKQSDALKNRIAELEAANAQLTKERDETYAALEVQTTVNKELVSKNNDLSATVEKGSALVLTSVQIAGVKEKSNGSFVTRKRANPVDAFQVCYNVAENAIAASGNRTFYIEVKNPSGALIGGGESATVGSTVLAYSKSTTFLYENQSIDVCDYIKGAKFTAGSYTVNVYDDQLRLLSTSTVALK